MWKIALAFVAFAAAALLLLSQGGDIDMSGETHGAETSADSHAPAPAASSAASGAGP